VLVSKSAGFTLLELLITMAIISILTFIAAPSFTAFIKRDRLVTNANQLHGIFKFARSEAIKRDQVVSLESNKKQWLVKTEVDAKDTTLNQFTITHSSISINLKDIAITSTGELDESHQFVVTDKDTDTNDITLCVLQSGQSWLTETSAC
jgi:type IV fimbrial biogenesis protein FimT